MQPNGDRRYVWAGSELIEERTSDWSVVTRRYYNEGAQRFSSAGALEKTYVYGRDHLGSVRTLCDTNGTVQVRYDYDPFGNRTSPYQNGTAPDIETGYTGHWYHGSSGLHLALFRGYDSESGRWLNRDPIGERGGINLYAYVLNSPINRTDPLGLLDLVIGGEADLVPILGGEASLGIVIDFDSPLDSGINLAGGLGGGANAGIAWTAGLFRECEGTSLNADLNVGTLGLTGNWDLPSGAFNGAAISVGPGGGASLTAMKSGTLSVRDVINWVKDLFR